MTYILFEASGEIGGQFNMAKRIPGKEEFYETLRYFGKMIEKQGVTPAPEHPAEADFLLKKVFGSGTRHGRRAPNARISKASHPKVLSYIDVLRARERLGEKVAIIGAGGIGFDVAMFLTQTPSEQRTQPKAGETVEQYRMEWGIDAALPKPRRYHGTGACRMCAPKGLAAAAHQKSRRTTGQNHRLGAPPDAEKPRRSDVARCTIP
jgi:2,4-dienoyl-CoA reductase (NADPH2)